MCERVSRNRIDDRRGAVDLVHRFSETHSFADLRSAVDVMVSAFKAIEQSYDPTYDPYDRNNWPIIGLRDPRDIQDPKERAWTEATLAANPQKMKRAAIKFSTTPA